MSEPPVPQRFVVTGTPGAGKTTVLGILRDRGWAVVDEAATAVNETMMAAGIDEPWRADSFIDDIVRLQVGHENACTAAVQLLDRSPFCTLALARHLDRPVSPQVETVLTDAVRDGRYQPAVFFLRFLGFITPTEVRRISYADSVRFEVIHEQVYREFGFDIVDIPVAEPDARATLIEQSVRLQS